MLTKRREKREKREERGVVVFRELPWPEFLMDMHNYWTSQVQGKANAVRLKSNMVLLDTNYKIVLQTVVFNAVLQERQKEEPLKMGNRGMGIVEGFSGWREF